MSEQIFSSVSDIAKNPLIRMMIIKKMRKVSDDFSKRVSEKAELRREIKKALEEIEGET